VVDIFPAAAVITSGKLNLTSFGYQFFQLDVYNGDGTPLTEDQVCDQLERICSASQETNVEPVGILTTQHRDCWGKAYLALIQGESVQTSTLRERLLQNTIVHCFPVTVFVSCSGYRYWSIL